MFLNSLLIMLSFYSDNIQVGKFVFFNKNSHRNFVHNSPKLEKAQRSINRQMHKHVAEHCWVLRRSKLLMYITTSIDLKNIVDLDANHERTQTNKPTYMIYYYSLRLVLYSQKHTKFIWKRVFSTLHLPHFSHRRGKKDLTLTTVLRIFQLQHDLKWPRYTNPT